MLQKFFRLERAVFALPAKPQFLGRISLWNFTKMRKKCNLFLEKFKCLLQNKKNNALKPTETLIILISSFIDNVHLHYSQIHWLKFTYNSPLKQVYCWQYSYENSVFSIGAFETSFSVVVFRLFWVICCFSKSWFDWRHAQLGQRIFDGS